MAGQPEWLPELVSMGDYGDWNAYLAALYEYFRDDFVDDKPTFKGRELRLKRHPVSHGKEATFWHMISDGDDEENRQIDLRRCERIRWPRPIIENSTEANVKVWENVRRTSKGAETRICLWLEDQEYLVILADRKDYLLPWTAYVVDRSHQKAKLQKEYEAYWKNMR